MNDIFMYIFECVYMICKNTHTYNFQDLDKKNGDSLAVKMYAS